VVVTETVIGVGSVVVGIVLAVIIWFGERRGVREARFDSESGEEIE
jgi:uncharacterized membrane protein YqiK